MRDDRVAALVQGCGSLAFLPSIDLASIFTFSCPSLGRHVYTQCEKALEFSVSLIKYQTKHTVWLKRWVAMDR